MRRSATSRLAAIARLAEAADAPELAREARTVAERLDQGRFFVAVLGQFKRGKSTLINALAGAPLLPVGVAPVTSVVTVVRYGARAIGRLRLRDGEWQPIDVAELGEYVSEAIDTSLRAHSRFYFLPLNTEASPHWWSRLADHVRTAQGRERAVRVAGEAFLNRVLEANAHGVVGDYVDRIVESRRGIERAVRDTLRGAADAAVAASARAERLRTHGQEAVGAEAARLVELRRELDALVAS